MYILLLTGAAIDNNLPGFDGLNNEYISKENLDKIDDAMDIYKKWIDAAKKTKRYANSYRNEGILE